jgi:DNA repair exonuclease SbcCD nuclease subunit
VITDVHDTPSLGQVNKARLSHRLNYDSERLLVWDTILSVLSSEKEKGREVFLLFLGDIFDRPYKNGFSLTEANNNFIALSEACTSIYSVIGNHELTYYTDNPFWTLVTEISDKRVRTIRKVKQPVGVFPVIKITDKLVDGEVIFYFNHYGVVPYKVEESDNDKINIGLFHQEICAKEIFDYMQSVLTGNMWRGSFDSITSMSSTAKYQYAYFGHYHKVYGSWTIREEGKDVNIRYLASLIRTDHTEFNNNFLDRSIPIIRVDDGKFIGIEEFLFKLQPRELCIDEKSVELSQKAYEALKGKREVRNKVSLVDDPILNIRSKLISRPGLSIVNALQYDSGATLLDSMNSTLSSIIGIGDDFGNE